MGSSVKEEALIAVKFKDRAAERSKKETRKRKKQEETGSINILNPKYLYYRSIRLWLIGSCQVKAHL